MRLLEYLENLPTWLLWIVTLILAAGFVFAASAGTALLLSTSFEASCIRALAIIIPMYFGFLTYLSWFKPYTYLRFHDAYNPRSKWLLDDKALIWMGRISATGFFLLFLVSGSSYIASRLSAIH